MDIRLRVADGMLACGAASLLVSAPVMLRYRDAADEAPWLLGMAVFIGAAAYTRWRRPDDPAAWWFAFSAGAAAALSTADGFLAAAVGAAAELRVLAWLTFLYHLFLVVTVVGMAHVIGLFPDGCPQTRLERRLLRAMWVLFVFPPLVLLFRPTLLFPSFYDVTAVVNPFKVDGFERVGEIAAGLATLGNAAFGLGLVLLAIRYRRADAPTRRRMRWLMLPAVGAVFGVLADVTFLVPSGVVVVAYLATMFLVPVTIAVGLLHPNLFDVDVVLRRSVVYAVLWLVIATAYVVAAASLGVAAGQRFSIGMAITLTVVATLAFQPARRWLERVADRWVFGVRTNPADLITRLGAALEDTVELERLLPRMAATLEQGLVLRWARVRLDPVSRDDEEPALSVPIVLGYERLGVVECGPKKSGAFTADDEALVRTLARQAALAVRNVRLTAELEQSRVRLVRAQEAERRRIERNIHDGVQQDLVALIAHAGHTRLLLARDAAAGDRALAELQEGLRRVNTELRELAHGIHPSVLGDRGLLEAVEALAARSSVPVSVRADPSLRGERFAEEVEGAGYFAIAEALANVSKHASASRAEVRLARLNGSLEITVCDDGVGFSPWSAAGGGLANLAERLSALGGRLDVASGPGQGTTVTARLQVSGV